MSNAEEIRKDYLKKQQPINSLSSVGITSYDNDTDTTSNAEIIKLDYQKKLEHDKINEEIEEANALEAEKDSIALGMKPEEVVATKNWFHKTYDSYNSFFGEYIYRAGIGGAMEAGQQGVEALTEFIELGMERMSHEFQGRYATNENFKLGDSHIGASMAAEKWNSLSEEEQGKYRDLYKIYDEGDRIYFGNNITLKAPVLFPKIEEPKTMVGGFVRDVSQFMTTFVLSPGGKAKVGKYVIKGGIADALFDPEEGNLATFIKEFGFENEVLDFLDSKVDESADAEDRLKARIEVTEDPYERQLMEYDVEEFELDKNKYDVTLHQYDNELEAFMVWINKNWESLEDVAKAAEYTEEDERKYWIARMGKQAALDVYTTGKIGTGNLDSIAMMREDDQFATLNVAMQYSGLMSAGIGKIQNELKPYLDKLMMDGTTPRIPTMEGIEDSLNLKLYEQLTGNEQKSIQSADQSETE